MAAAELLAIGTNSTPSSDFTIASGAQLTVCLKDAAGTVIAGGAQVEIQLKDDVGQYFTVDTITSAKPGLVLAGAGTYRLVRRAAVSCGVFSG